MESMVARYDGRCAICDAKIVADEDFIVALDDEWVHEACAIDEGEEVER